MKHTGSLESTKDAKGYLRHSQEQLWLLECPPNFPSASYLDERTADIRTNCFITFSIFFFSMDLFADVMSMHNRNMKHAHAMEFD